MSDSSDTDQAQISEMTKASELYAAIREGDARKILGLIETGADIHYKRLHGAS